jgi:hypothetical protein
LSFGAFFLSSRDLRAASATLSALPDCEELCANALAGKMSAPRAKAEPASKIAVHL